jgi:hypothetical protein
MATSLAGAAPFAVAFVAAASSCASAHYPTSRYAASMHTDGKSFGAHTFTVGENVCHNGCRHCTADDRSVYIQLFGLSRHDPTLDLRVQAAPAAPDGTLDVALPWSHGRFTRDECSIFEVRIQPDAGEAEPWHATAPDGSSVPLRAFRGYVRLACRASNGDDSIAGDFTFSGCWK